MPDPLVHTLTPGVNNIVAPDDQDVVVQQPKPYPITAGLRVEGGRDVSLRGLSLRNFSGDGGKQWGTVYIKGGNPHGGVYAHDLQVDNTTGDPRDCIVLATDRACTFVRLRTDAVGGSGDGVHVDCIQVYGNVLLTIDGWTFSTDYQGLFAAKDFYLQPGSVINRANGRLLPNPRVYYSQALFLGWSTAGTWRYSTVALTDVFIDNLRYDGGSRQSVLDALYPGRGQGAVLDPMSGDVTWPTLPIDGKVHGVSPCLGDFVRRR